MLTGALHLQPATVSDPGNPGGVGYRPWRRGEQPRQPALVRLVVVTHRSSPAVAVGADDIHGDRARHRP